MQNDLLELKNLGNTSVNWLRIIGVHNLEELRQLGAVEAFARIKERDIKVSKVLLYALEGALQDIHWNDLPAEKKEYLVAQADQRCKTAV